MFPAVWKHRMQTWAKEGGKRGREGILIISRENLTMRKWNSNKHSHLICLGNNLKACIIWFYLLPPTNTESTLVHTVWVRKMLNQTKKTASSH